MRAPALLALVFSLVACSDQSQPPATATPQAPPAPGRANEKPPVPYIAAVPDKCMDGSCPGRAWTARQRVALHDKPGGGGAVLAELAPGEVVAALETTVHVIGVPAKVVFDQERFKAGDVFYVLHGQGEGFHDVWHYGEVSTQDLSYASATGKCAQPSARCWAEYGSYPQEKRWTHVRRGSGLEGWVVSDSRDFDGIYVDH